MVYGILLSLMDGLHSFEIVDKDNFASDFRTRTLTLVAIGCNAFFMQYFNNKKWTNSMRGLILPTMIYIAVWLINFFDLLF
jgi:hypothetical protein